MRTPVPPGLIILNTIAYVSPEEVLLGLPLFHWSAAQKIVSRTGVAYLENMFSVLSCATACVWAFDATAYGPYC